MAELSGKTVWSGERRLLRALFFAALLLVATEAGIFRSGLYFRVVEPNSYCGQVLTVLRGARDFDREAGKAGKILVLGDSRMAEGFSAKHCDEAGQPGLRWFNAAVSGATPRVWSYLLERMLRQGVRFDLVVVPLQSLAGRATEYGIADRTLDGQFMPPLLSLPQAPEFAWSFETPKLRREMLVQGFLSSFALKRDVLHLMSNPSKRLGRVDRARDAYKSHYAYTGRPEDLTGKIRVSGEEASFSEDMPRDERQNYEAWRKIYNDEVRPDELAYQRRWVGRIEEICREAGAELLVLRSPRGPLGELYDSEDEVDPHERLRLSPETIVLEAEAFSGLEKPEYFFDHLHMNARGREEFSAALLRYVSGIRDLVPNVSRESRAPSLHPSPEAPDRAFRINEARSAGCDEALKGRGSG